MAKQKKSTLKLGQRFGYGLTGAAKTKKIQSAARAMSRFAVAYPSTYKSMIRKK